MPQTLTLAVCMGHGMTLSDFITPIEMLTSFNMADDPQLGMFVKDVPYRFKMEYLAPAMGPVSAVSPIMVTVNPTMTYDAAIQSGKQFDVIWIPAAMIPDVTNGKDMTPPEEIAFLKHQAPGAKYVLSVCGGSLSLATAGLLEGKRATTNKMFFRAIEAISSKKITWVPKARWVVDGNIWTSSGVTAGSDMALAFIEHLTNAKTARDVRGMFEVTEKSQEDDPFAEFHVTLDLPQALLLAYGECGPDATEEEFHDWYNTEHAPMRLTVKGITNALRYKAVDSATPTWLALYDMATPEVMLSEGYLSLRGKASKREADIVARLSLLNRRLYSQISSLTLPTTQDSSLPGKYLLIVSMEPTPEGEADFNKWYEEEHMAMLAKVPGWLRGRRYKCVNQVELAVKAAKPEMPVIPYLAIHEWDRPDFMDLPEYEEARNTPWRLEVIKTIVKREVRRFELYKVIAKPE